MTTPLLLSLTVVSGLLMTGALTGCTPGGDPQLPSKPSATDISTFGDAGSARVEYVEATTRYELPAGESYPEPSFDDAAGLYEAGFGESEVVLFWNCAWGQEYLELRGGDAAAAATALEEFASLAETDAYDRYFDPVSVHPVFEAAVEDARLGDPTAVQSIVEGSCTS